LAQVLTTESHPSSTAHNIIFTWQFHRKICSDWFHGVKILQGRCQHGEEVRYWYPSRLEKTICKWDIYVPLVTKGVMNFIVNNQEIFETNSSVHNIKTHNKDHLHRPNANLSCFKKKYILC
jgi:hypothetical protein